MSASISPAAVKRSPSNGISVLVSGAGVGGLYTALECWRRGCDVRIFERTNSNVTTGDSFTIGTSALDSFKHWPWLQERSKEIGYLPLAARCTETGKRITEPFDFSEMLGIKVPINRHSRPKFHGMLLKQMRSIGLNVEYGNEVIDYFEDEARGRAGVVVKDGSRHEADLVVAADGLRGKSWQLVAGKPVPAQSSGEAIFRVAYPVEIALADPMIAERFPMHNGRSVIELWNGPGITATFWRNEDEMSWGISHVDDGSAEESWSNRVKAEDVLKLTSTIPGWPEVANRVIMATPPGQLIDWKLMWRDPQPKWTSPGGRVIQLGDAGHTFLPTSGNGGTQAMEDAISLAACLKMAGDKEHVPDATRVHNLLRFERVSCLQAFGVENRQKHRDSGNDKTINNDAEKVKAKMPRLGKWILAHDPESYAFEKYEEALSHLQNGTPFKNTNIPPNIVYRPWTIDTLLEARAKGEPTILDGDWS